MFTTTGYGRCEDDPVFLEGFRHYCWLVQQQANFHSSFWFDRARPGLQSIGPLQSLTICNTWEILFFFRYNDELNQVNDAASVEVFAQCLRDGDLQLVRNRGLGKSPVARSMPPTVVLPMARANSWHQPYIQKLRKKPLSDRSLEFAVVVELLKSSGQQPLEIMVPGDCRQESRLPAIIFDTTWPTSTSLPIVCRKLEILDMELASHNLEPMHCLQSLLKETTSLRKLSLTLPYDPDNDAEADNIQDLTHILQQRGAISPPYATSPSQAWRHRTAISPACSSSTVQL